MSSTKFLESIVGYAVRGKMRFDEKLVQLRREKGYSQEQLAGLLEVSRQSVSKWESGNSMPEIEKLITIAEIFGVSLDYLLRDYIANREEFMKDVPVTDNTEVMEQLAEIKQQLGINTCYEFKSKRKLFGIPLVHIKLSKDSRRDACAKGIIAIGNFAVGVISIGGITLGVISLGGISLGLLALGALAFGGLSIGAVSIGGIAFGGVAIGIYAAGGVVLAQELAVGGVATGKVAVGSEVSGEHTLKVVDQTREQIKQFIELNCPHIWNGIKNIFSFFTR